MRGRVGKGRGGVWKGVRRGGARGSEMESGSGKAAVVLGADEIMAVRSHV